MKRLSIAFLCLLSVVKSEIEKPVFRILAPQFLCDAATKKDGNSTEIAPPSQITIGMQTKGGQKLRYVVSIFFDIINGFQNQQHTMKIWKSIRMLEHKIKKNERNISENNQIDIDNKELTSGVVYTFTIIGINEQGVYSEAQNFTVTFKNGVAATAVQQDGSAAVDGVSLLLIGAEITYADIEYLVEAQLTLCNPTNDYHFKWEMADLPAQYENITKITGKTLRIPPNVLDGGKDYEILLKLMKTSDSFMITQARIKLKVLLRGFDVTIVPQKTVVGVDREVQLKLIINDYDNYKDQAIEWKCFDAKQKECNLFEPSQTSVQTMRLFETGDYTVQGSVKVNGVEKKVTSTVVAEDDIYCSVRFENFPDKPIIAGNKFMLDATISDLIPDCFAEWEIVNETGFAFFDSKLLPNGFGQLLVRNVEENFLSELVDYGNDTVEREIDLLVPAAYEVPDFPGLESNARYKFRLTSICPKPISDEAPKAPRNNITSYTDIVLETNGPPRGSALDVEPSKGVALKTLFKFSTGIAYDISADYPLKYSFFYSVAKLSLKIGEYYENMLATTELPYSKSPISTYYEVCDSRMACSVIVGPNVTVNLVENISESEMKFRVEQIATEMSRMEYDSAFEKAISTMVTLREFNDTTFSNQFQSKMVKIIEIEIVKLKSEAEKSFYVADSTAISFVKLSKIVLNIMQVSDDAITTDLLQILHNTVPGGVNNLAENFESRLKRETVQLASRVGRTTDETEMIKIALSLSENLLNSANKTTVSSAKLKLRNDVRTYVERLCRRVKPGDEVFDEKYVKFQTLSKISARQLVSTNLTVPFANFPLKSFVQLGFLLETDPSKKMCVGKLYYPMDIVSNDGDANYEVMVFEEADGKFVAKTLKTDTEAIMINISKPSGKAGYKCVIWNNNQWTPNLCKTITEKDTNLQCKCSKIGYFKLKIIEDLSSAVPLTVATTSELTSLASAVAEIAPTTQATTIEDTKLITDVASTLSVIDLSTGSKHNHPTVSEFVAKTTVYGLVGDLKTTKAISVGTTASTGDRPIRFPDNLESISSTKTQGTTTFSTPVLKSSTASYLPYAIVGSAVALLALTWLLVYCIRRRKKFTAIPSNLSILNIEPRVQQPGIRYARFHDEHLMRGDIFDTST